MGKGLEYTFFRKRHINYQQVQEKTFNIIHHEGKGSQSHNEVSTPDRINIMKKKKIYKIISVDEDVEKMELLCSVGDVATYGKQY